MADIKENNVEWFSDQKYCCVTVTSTKYINKIKKIHDKHPDEFQDFIEDKENGYLYAKIPLKWWKISPGSSSNSPKREMTEDQKEALRERLAKARAKKRNK